MVDARIVAAANAANTAIEMARLAIEEVVDVGMHAVIFDPFDGSSSLGAQRVVTEKVRREIEIVTRDVTDGMTHHIIATSVIAGGWDIREVMTEVTRTNP